MSERYSLSLVTPPGGEPVTLAEVKAWARIDTSEDDALLTGLIADARQHFDGKDAWFGRALMTQTWDLFMDCFPYEADTPYDDAPGICVPLPPLQAVTSINYIDSAGTPTLLAGAEYLVDSKSEPGRIVPAFGKVWPATRTTINAVTVRFVAGYGAASAVPQPILEWIKQATAYLYEHREAPQLPQAFFWSMARYKVAWGF